MLCSSNWSDFCWIPQKSPAGAPAEASEKELRALSDSPNSLFHKADRAFITVVRSISYLSAVCLVGIMLVAFFNVIGEKLRQVGLPVSGIPASTEIIQYLHIPVAFLASAYVTMDRGHTKVDLLSNKLPQIVQTICFVLGDLVGSAICAVISWRAFVQMGKFIARHRMSSVSGVGFPLWPFALIAALSFAMLSVSLLWDIIRKLYLAKHPAPGSKNGGAV